MLEVLEPHPECEVCRRSKERWIQLNVQMRRAENGYIIVHRGNEFIFQTPVEASLFIREKLEEAP